MLKIYNTLSRSKEEFVPITAGHVGIYACGTTPYKPAHLGHAMQGVVFDVIRRYVEYRGFSVNYVRNYTDVDDKIIAEAARLGIDALTHSQNIIAQSDAEFAALGVMPPTKMVKVSDHIPDIIAMIQEIIAQDFGYATDAGNVYFRVKKFTEYGKLSNQKLDELRHGVRKDLEQDKEDDLDFALWKTAKPDEISWDSPWGKGRPGWHIECSAMSNKYLGEYFDIHGGGADLMFPHHENEIAQSESIHAGKFAKYWMHNGLLFIGGEKMSKSLGNEITVSEMLTQYHPQTIRYLILTNHYRSRADFLHERYREANLNVYAVYKVLEQAEAFLADHAKEIADGSDKEQLRAFMEVFETSMDDDFNTVQAIVDLQTAASALRAKMKQEDTSLPIVLAHVAYIQTAGKILGLFDEEPSKVLRAMEDLHLKRYMLTREMVNEKIAERAKLRAEGDYGRADQIAQDLSDASVSLLDSKAGTTWEPRY